MMCVFCKKGIVITLVVLMFSTVTNANPLISNDASNKTQMEQFLEVYNILMKEKKDSKKEVSMLKTSYTSIKTPKKITAPAKRLRVTATAYTSHVGQTDSTPNIAAWGDRLSPGMKVIAVSRDLLNQYGLKHKQKVRIKGLDGHYVVLDKMNKRWRKKIDIYMGMNKHKAFQWGRRKVEIMWN